MGEVPREVKFARLLGYIVVLAVIVYAIEFFLTKDVEIVKTIIPISNRTLAITYAYYIVRGIDALLVGVGGYLIILLLQRLINRYISVKIPDSSRHIFNIIIEGLLYLSLVLAVLATLGINLTGAAIGGAVVGITIGLAAQTFVSNLLSGLTVASSKTLTPGDSVILNSWIWGSPIIGKVKKVSILFTDIYTTSGNAVRIPNSAFLGNTIFTKLDSEHSISYPYTLSVNADVPATDLKALAEAKIKDLFEKEKLTLPEIYFTGKLGVTNSFTVIIHVNDLEKLNQILTFINSAFDKAYWELKNKK